MVFARSVAVRWGCLIGSHIVAQILGLSKARFSGTSGAHQAHSVCTSPTHPIVEPRCLVRATPPQAGGGGEGFEVQKYGDGRVALIGFPSGKASPCPDCMLP